MSMNDGKILLNEELDINNLSKIIKGLSYHIAMDFIAYLNDEWDGQDEWEYTIKAMDDNYTLKIKINEWNLPKKEDV